MRVAKLFPAFVAILIPVASFGATANVTVGPGLSFTPSSVTIAPGDTVQWNFAGVHTTTSDTATGPEVWDSGVLSSGSFSHTFNTVGDWPYYCSLHSVPGGTAMNGVVHVLAPAPAPTLTSVNPASGSTAGGTGVTLNGTNFDASCTVDFGGAAGTAVAVPTSTTITATTPAHAAGTVNVTVTCSGGSATLTNAFTFNTAPAIASVSPTAALPGATITITGSGFQNGATVTFAGVASPTVTFVSATTLQAVVPNIATGPATIVVTNPDTQTASFTGFAVTSLQVPAMSPGTLLLLVALLALAGAWILR